MEDILILMTDSAKEAGCLLRQMGIHTDTLKVVASMENQETIKRSVSRGVGISVISRLAADDAIKLGDVLCFLYKSLEMYRVHGKSVRGTFQAIYTKSGDMVHISLLVGLLALSGCAVCMVIIAAYKNGRKRNS